MLKAQLGQLLYAHYYFHKFIIIHAAPVVLFSVASVSAFACLSVFLSLCLSVNTITPEPLEIPVGYYHEIFRESSYGQRGGQSRKWLYIGGRVVI